jgi:hypothetical protein
LWNHFNPNWYPVNLGVNKEGTKGRWPCDNVSDSMSYGVKSPVVPLELIEHVINPRHSFIPLQLILWNKWHHKGVIYSFIPLQLILTRRVIYSFFNKKEVVSTSSSLSMQNLSSWIEDLPKCLLIFSSMEICIGESFSPF